MISLSLAEVFDLRGRAFAEIRQHTTAIDRLGAALGEFDFALQGCIDEKNIDAMQGLVTAARQLSDAMDGRAA